MTATDSTPVDESAAAVLITGAAGALGAAAVRAFLAAGKEVIGFDRDPMVSQLLREPGQRYSGMVVDVGDEQELARAVEQAAAGCRLGHVIGIAGGALPPEPTAGDDPAGLDVETFRGSLEANLTTQFLMLRATLGWLRANAGASRSITFTSSFNALSGQGMPAYSAAKAGLIGMMHALTPGLGAEGIRVNVLAPGTIRTPRTERIWQGVPEHFERLEASTALGRLGSPDDVAAAFVALALRLTHVTGQVLVVDGGQTVVHR